MKNYEKPVNQSAKTLSPELRQICGIDSLYSKELFYIVTAHEYEAVRNKKENFRIWRNDYTTSKGLIRIHSIFTENGKLKYSHTALKVCT